MTGVRVVRIMEYEYESLEAANADMAHWQVPPQGSHTFGPTGHLIRSTIMLPHEHSGHVPGLHLHRATAGGTNNCGVCNPMSLRG